MSENSCASWQVRWAEFNTRAGHEQARLSPEEINEIEFAPDGSIDIN